jgi:hypothetical protein
MNTGHDIQEELKSMGSILAGMSRAMPYVVPDGYFEQFGGSLTCTIKDLAEADINPGWDKAMPYAVPQGYFEALANEITVKAARANLSKGVPLDVPVGYFETFPQQMLQAAKASEPKLIPLKRRSLLLSIKWAAAAILVIGIGLGSYRAFFNSGDLNSTEHMLSSVPSTEIQDYLQHNYRVDVDRLVANNSVNNMNLDNKDIIQYLNETGWD